MSITFFIIYVLIVWGIGYYGYKRTQSLLDFHVAGRNLGLIPAAGTFAASYVSAATVVGYVGYAYAYGWALFSYFIVGISIGWILLQIISAKLFYFRAITVPDFFESRYNSTFMRAAGAFVYICLLVIYLIIQMKGAGLIVETLTGIPYSTAVIIVGIIFLAYTIAGGMNSVAWTDVIQFIFMLFATVVTALFVLKSVGSITALNAKLMTIAGGPVNNPPGGLVHPTVGGVFSYKQILSTSFMAATATAAAPYYLMRYYACRNLQVARGMVGISGIFIGLLYVAIVITGAGARILITEKLPTLDHTLPILLSNYLPGLIGSFALIAVASAIMSTTDSILLLIGSSFAHDVYSKYINPLASDKQELAVARWATLIFGALAIILSINPPGMIYEIYVFYGAFMAAFIPPLFLGAFWKPINRPGGIASLIGGICIGIIWQILKTPGGIHASVPVVIGGIIIGVLVSSFTAEEPIELTPYKEKRAVSN